MTCGNNSDLYGKEAKAYHYLGTDDTDEHGFSYE